MQVDIIKRYKQFKETFYILWNPLHGQKNLNYPKFVTNFSEEVGAGL